MSSLLSSASLPVFKLMLSNLKFCLEKAQKDAAQKGFDPQVFVEYRLAPDMLPFKKQVMIACDAAKLCVARIAKLEAPKFEDNETDFSQLIERVGKTIEWISTVSAEQMDKGAGSEITFQVGKTMTKTMKAEDYLTQWALPNMYFHITTTYTILRHNGVPLGKIDYLSGAAGA